MDKQISTWIAEIVNAHYDGQLSVSQTYKRIGDCYVVPAAHNNDDAHEWVITCYGTFVAHAFDYYLAKQLMAGVKGACELRRVDSRGGVHLELVRH